MRLHAAIYSEPVRADDGDDPVRFVMSAGMPAAIWSSFEERFGVQIFEWYGAVEGGLALKPIGQGPVCSFGRPGPGLETKVLDLQDRECAAGEMGEICSRPVDGWFFFDYRKGGGIRHNGDFVNAGFVEKAIAEEPSVSDVFVFGVKAASGAPGEKDVVAAIVALDTREFDAAAVFARCRRALELNFVPSYLQVVEEIPKTASEKPQERFLLETFDPAASNVFTEGR